MLLPQCQQILVLQPLAWVHLPPQQLLQVEAGVVGVHLLRPH